MSRSLRSVVGACVLLITMPLGAASAADMPLKAPPVPPAYSWTGFYLGGDIGGVWTTSSATWNPLPSPAVFGANPTTGSNNASGFIGGLHGGYNYQLAPVWVGGIEGDWMWTSTTGSLTQPWFFFPAGPAVPTSSTTLSERLNWLSSIRGRLGYLVTPATLLYATGGAAWANFTYNGNAADPGAVYTAPASLSNTQTGFVVGGGLEYMLSAKWFVRGEYLYYRFTPGANITGTSPLNPAFPSNYVWGATNISVARAGVSYKF